MDLILAFVAIIGFIGAVIGLAQAWSQWLWPEVIAPLLGKGHSESASAAADHAVVEQIVDKVVARRLAPFEGRLGQLAEYLDGLPNSPDQRKRQRFEAGRAFEREFKWREAIRAYQECGSLATEPPEQAALAILIGNARLGIGELDQAQGEYRDAERISREAGVKEGQAAALGNLGLVYQAKGELDQALDHHQRALKIHQEIGYRQGEASDLGNLGLIYRDKGELDQALDHHQRALKIHREIGYRQGEANALGNLGVIYQVRGDLERAEGYHKEALELDKEIGNKEGQANDLGNMGLVYQAKGELDQALDHHQQALVIDREIGYRQGEANALGNLGLVYLQTGNIIDEARNSLKDALAIFRAIGAAPQIALVEGWLKAIPEAEKKPS